MLSNEAVRDIEALIHPNTNLVVHREKGPTLRYARAKGIHVYDETGREYIEGLGGLWCTSLGYGNEELVEVAAEQMRNLSFAHVFYGRTHEPVLQLAERLKEISPIPVSKIFFTASGSEANDTQVKLVWLMNNMLDRPRKKKFISRRNGYHGITVASGSMTGIPMNHNGFDLPQPGFLHTTYPHYYRMAAQGETEEQFSQRLADDLEALILREDPDTIAAFIAEPVMGGGGALVTPQGYFAAVEKVLKRYDIYFITDEVICGFGRTGNMFGCETLGARPHSMSAAKAITSAYFPMGAVWVPEPMYQALLEHGRRHGNFGHGYTYSGHPVGAAVATKVLEIYQRDRILDHVRARSTRFLARLAGLMDHPLIGDARGVGLIGGAEIVKDKATKEQFDPKWGLSMKSTVFAQEEGLILRPLGGDRVAFCPPLIITDEQIDEMFDRYWRALDKTLQWVREMGAD